MMQQGTLTRSNTHQPLGHDQACFEDVVTLMEGEDLTNGVWNAILAHHFPYPQYLVVPEYRVNRKQSQGRYFKVDLAVIDQEQNNRAILIYEGKKEGGAMYATYDAIQQAHKSAKALGCSPHVVVAVGTTFMLGDSAGQTFFMDKNNCGLVLDSENERQVGQQFENLKKCTSRIHMLPEISYSHNLFEAGVFKK
jgi:uncharacterized glyoxalase superfamily protein PhnB